jgi:small ligand-binding sensory domain FIST
MMSLGELHEMKDKLTYGRVFAAATVEAETIRRTQPRCARSHLGPLGLAGFFCNGEIGPVGEKNFLHGYTASLALFSQK